MTANDKPANVTAELQQADDMLTALMEQRNAALNEVVQLRAQLRAAAREMESLKVKIPQPPAEVDKPATAVNGHDTHAAAPAPVAAEPKPASVKVAKPVAPPKVARKRGRPKKTRPAAAPAAVAAEPTWSSAPMVATSEPPPDAAPTG